MSKKIELTPAQKVAVNLRGHSMLVSAAAGSGKTAVLTKRIIKLVTDTDNPTDISDLLVVTFTKAAANELRERISSAIYEALREDPLNKHLSSQLMKLGKAKICTIHSFCYSLIKSNFQLLNLSSSSRIADESEASLICNNIMSSLIDSCYGGLYDDRIKDFTDFVEQLLDGKGEDGLSFVLVKIYNDLRAYPDGLEILKKSAEELSSVKSDSVLGNKWGIYLKVYLKRCFEHYMKRFESACKYFETDEVYSIKYLPAFESAKRQIYNVFSKIETGSYTDILNAIDSWENVSLKSVSSDYQTKEGLYYKELRSDFNAVLKKIKSKFFSFSEQTIKEHFIRTARFNETLYEFLKLFDAEFEAEKKRRGLLDYSDLERYALRLLYTDKIPNQFAKELRLSYKHIFIDEYQDVNELQDKIFSAISTETNRFMVGDIKQSIYGFRGAEPQIFSDYRTKFPEYEEEIGDSNGVTLYLSNNFRSNESVIDFSNAVFKVLFNNNSRKVPYTEGDKLVFSKEPNDAEEYDVRLCFAENIGDMTANEAEAEFVADEVAKLIKEGTEPSDIVLLFRSKTKTEAYENALKKRNILCYNREEKDFFENDAVLLMLCILNIIDNPTRDIYLAGALKSPLFRFTMSDLTDIRRYDTKGSLYDALVKYTDQTKNEKASYFINRLFGWRKYSEGCPVDELVRKIYKDTHIVELLSGKKNSDSDIERQANLLLLYDYARQFENGSFKGLYNFILYLNDVMEKKTRLANARVIGEGKGVVNLMTVHNSKGLEFDTVFLCDTSHLFNTDDEKKAYNMHKEYGLTLRLRDKTSFGRFNTLPKCIADLSNREEALDEELRVLYVALTRAKKRLIITSSVSKARELIGEISSDHTEISQYVLTETRCPAELILWGILKSDYKKYSIEYFTPTGKTGFFETDSEKVILDNNLISEYEDIIRERLSFEYPYKELSLLPSKLSVSKLYPTVLDEYTAEIETSAPAMYTKPRFLLPDNQRVTGAERGTATHMFMQFCDFARVLEKGIDYELNTLVEKGFMDKRNAELVNKKNIEIFFESDFFKSVLKAKKAWRERRFNIKLPASQFTENKELKASLSDESVLVQGVIDILYIDENDRLVLADYKTDSFTKGEIESGEAEKILLSRHSNQLSYYAEACKKMFGRSVDSIMIYSFALGKGVKVK